jgi:hypothetical protein
MRIAKLIELIEKAGGRFVLENRQASLAWPERLTRKQRCRARTLDGQVRKQAYLVCAELLEREEGRRWQRQCACHCSTKPFAHPPHRPEDVWRELRNLFKGREEKSCDAGTKYDSEKFSFFSRPAGHLHGAIH